MIYFTVEGDFLLWGEFMAKNLEIAYLLDFYGDMLTEKQRNAIDLYYNDD